MIDADDSLQAVDLFLLPFDLRLLLFDRVDKNGGQPIILHALDFAFRIVSNKQRGDASNILRSKTHAQAPKKELLLPVTLYRPVERPKKELRLAVVLYRPTSVPNIELLLPVVLLVPA